MYELQSLLAINTLSEELDFDLEPCQTSGIVTFFQTVLGIGLLLTVVFSFMMFYQRHRSKQRHIQAVVQGAFLVTLLVTAGAFAFVHLYFSDCVKEIEEAATGQDRNISGIFSSFDFDDDESEDLYTVDGVPYASLPVSASEWDLDDERECSTYISSIGGMFPMTVDDYEEDEIDFVTRPANSTTAADGSLVEYQMEPFCQGALGSWANVNEQRAFRRLFDLPENLCVVRQALNSPKFYLKYRASTKHEHGLVAQTFEDSEQYTPLFGWSTTRVRAIRGFTDEGSTGTTTTSATPTTTTTTAATTATTTTLPATTGANESDAGSSPLTEIEMFCREQLLGTWDRDNEVMPAEAAGFNCIDPELEYFEGGGQNVTGPSPFQTLEMFARQIDYSSNNAYNTLVEAVDVCARDCACTGIVLVEEFDTVSVLFYVATALLLVIVFLVMSVWMCTIAGGRCACPQCRIFLAEQDSVVYRHKAARQMRREVAEVRKTLQSSVKAAFVEFAEAHECLKTVHTLSNLGGDDTMTWKTFSRWSSPTVVSAAKQAMYFMTPKPGDDIESCVTVTSHGEAVNSYPDSWPRHVRIARGICDALTTLSFHFNTAAAGVCKVGSTTESVRQQLQAFSKPIEALFQQAKWYYLARRQRGFAALADLLVLETLVSTFKEVEGGKIKSSYEDFYNKLVVSVKTRVKRGKDTAFYDYSKDTRVLCQMLSGNRYRGGTGQHDDSNERVRSAGPKKVFTQGPLGMRAIDLYISAAMAIPYLQSTLDVICKWAVSTPKVARLKNLWRIAEKAMSRTDKHAGELIFVNDVCRAQAIFDRIDKLHNSLAALTMLPNVVVVRVKDRFSHPASGGWSDIMVNLFHVNDPNQHVCEIQFCLGPMLRLRQDMDGHADFNRFRGSAEILEQCHYTHQLLPRHCKKPGAVMRETFGSSSHRRAKFKLGISIQCGGETLEAKATVPVGTKPLETWPVEFKSGDTTKSFDVPCPPGVAEDSEVFIEAEVKQPWTLSKALRRSRVQPGSKAKGPRFTIWLVDPVSHEPIDGTEWQSFSDEKSKDIEAGSVATELVDLAHLRMGDGRIVDKTGVFPTDRVLTKK